MLNEGRLLYAPSSISQRRGVKWYRGVKCTSAQILMRGVESISEGTNIITFCWEVVNINSISFIYTYNYFIFRICLWFRSFILMIPITINWRFVRRRLLRPREGLWASLSSEREEAIKSASLLKDADIEESRSWVAYLLSYCRTNTDEDGRFEFGYFLSICSDPRSWVVE
jgi:hypothetical protein